jgi:hypothetical protein
MEEIKENDVVVSLRTQRTSSSYCEIQEGYINKAHNISLESNVIWFNETAPGEGAYEIKHFRLATEKECKLFEEKGPHILSHTSSEDLAGRYVKALKDQAQCTYFKKGEYALIRSGKPNAIILEPFGFVADLYKEDCWVLMSEGFDPNANAFPACRFNVGDVVDLNNLGYQYTDMGRNANNPHYTWAVISNCNIRSTHRTGCMIEDKVYSPTMDVWWYKFSHTGNWISEGGLTLSIKASDTSVKSNYKVGDWVVMTEDYAGELIKGKVFQIVNRQGGICWVINHSDKPYLAPYERLFRMAEPHEIPTAVTPDIETSPLLYGVVSRTTSGTTSGTSNLYLNGELHPCSLPTSWTQVASLSSTLFQEIPKAILNNVNNVPHQEPKILRQKTKKRKLVIVNQ